MHISTVSSIPIDLGFNLINNKSLDKAFRHGDIENVLEELVKFSGSGIGGSSLLGIASSVLHQVTGGSKFSKSDIKKVYFVSIGCISVYHTSNFVAQGNWLRDYSQVCSCDDSLMS